LLAVMLCSIPMLVAAQGRSTESASRSNPADSSVNVPSAVYRSAFAGYQGFAGQKVDDWRNSNDKVGQIGGWRAYAKEGRGAASGATPADGTSGPASPADPHLHR